MFEVDPSFYQPWAREHNYAVSKYPDIDAKLFMWAMRLLSHRPVD